MAGLVHLASVHVGYASALSIKKTHTTLNNNISYGANAGALGCVPGVNGTVNFNSNGANSSGVLRTPNLNLPQRELISSLHFDYQQELLWAGFDSGYLSSFALPGFEVYSSRRVSMGPVTQLQTHASATSSVDAAAAGSKSGSGILAFSPSALSLSDRRAAVIHWTLCPADLACSSFTSVAPASRSSSAQIWLATNYCKIAVVSAYSGRVVRETPPFDCPVSHMRAHGPHTVVAALTSGSLRVFDTRANASSFTSSASAATKIAVHAGTFSDILVVPGNNNLIACCGPHLGVPMLTVVDIRATRSPLVLPCRPHRLCALEELPSCILAAEPYSVSLFDVNSGNLCTALPFEVPTVAIASSLSGDYVAVADVSSDVHLFTPRDLYQNYQNNRPFSSNHLSDPVVLPSAVFPPQRIAWDQDEDIAAVVGLPYYKDTLLSGLWPSKKMHSAGLPTACIDVSVQESAKFSADTNMSYAPRPSTLRPNQWPYRQVATAGRFKSTRQSGSLATPSTSATDSGNHSFDMSGNSDKSNRSTHAAHDSRSPSKNPSTRTGGNGDSVTLDASPSKSTARSTSPRSHTRSASPAHHSASLVPNTLTGTGSIWGSRTARNSLDVDSTNDYKFMRIEYSRFGVLDFDFEFFNDTSFPGLESGLPSSYVNNYLQALFFSHPIQALAQSHAVCPCPRDPCLLCESGDLFRMLQVSYNKNGAGSCRAANWLSAFNFLQDTLVLYLRDSSTPPSAPVNQNLAISSSSTSTYNSATANATTLGPSNAANHVVLGSATAPPAAPAITVMPMLGEKPLCLKMQQCARFLFEQFNREAATEKSMCDYTMVSTNISQCHRCQTTERRETQVLTVELLYPGARMQNPGASFADLLRNTFSSRQTLRSWCEKCRSYTGRDQHRKILKLPNVLQISSNVTAERNFDWWCSDEIRFTKPSTLSLNSNNSNSATALLASKKPGAVGAPGGFFLPVYLRMEPLKNGNVAVSVPQNAHNAASSSELSAELDEHVYVLSALISEVRLDRPHIISHVQVHEGIWYLFNDFKVREVPRYHALQFPRWKVPSLFHYTRLSSFRQWAEVTTESPIWTDNDLFNGDHALNETKCYEPLDLPLGRHELGPSFAVSIDCEFVALREEIADYTAEGNKKVVVPAQLSLARVSAVRAAGPHRGTTCIDDYILPRECIADYLTEYSGIQPEDLDPSRSMKHLVPLRAAYRKLRCMADAGVRFIGHGLAQDFRILNLCVYPNQVTDTVTLYHLPAKQRKLSLKFLAWAVLASTIQTQNHDSIEDARTALALYDRFLETKESNTWDTLLNEVYRVGQTCGFRAPSTQVPARLRTTSTTNKKIPKK